MGQTEAIAINNHGQVAANTTQAPPPGVFWNPLDHRSANVWYSGHFTPIPAPDASCLTWTAADINDAGHVLVNCGTPASPRKAYLWNGSTFTNLFPVLVARSLNDNDEVVGVDDAASYRWTSPVDVVRILSAPDVVEINNAGQIIYTARTSSGWFGIRLTPRP